MKKTKKFFDEYQKLKIEMLCNNTVTNYKKIYILENEIEKYQPPWSECSDFIEWARICLLSEVKKTVQYLEKELQGK